MSAGDPVSWLLIEPGWHVVDSDAEEIGRVEQIAGDTEADIFSGLLISTGLISGTRYVPAEQVGPITEGRVQLRLTRAEAKHLSAHEGPGLHD
jgi:uncharacterized protein DUF2171